MNSTEQLQLFDTFAAKLRETLVKKGSDYANETDVLDAIKSAANIVGLETEKAINLFIATKIVRINNLSGSDKEAQNEPLEDSILDLCGYAFLLLCAITEKKTAPELQSVFNIKSISENYTHFVKDKEWNDVFFGSLRDCLDFLSRKMDNGGFFVKYFDEDYNMSDIENESTGEYFRILKI